MGSRSTVEGAGYVYEVADLWIRRALKADDSLFTPCKPIWSSELLEELFQKFLGNPEALEGPGFPQKLRELLSGSESEVYQLMGEVHYICYLIVWKGAMGSKRKEYRINQVLGWSPQPQQIPCELIPGLTPGIVHPGPSFLGAYFRFQLGFIIEFVKQWKEQNPGESLLDRTDPQAPGKFKKFLTTMSFHSPLLRNDLNKPRMQREAILHLIHPDAFEAIVSVDDKIGIARTFEPLATQPTEDIDYKLKQIREGLEAFSCNNFHSWWKERYKAK